jgi:hypothetical protein
MAIRPNGTIAIRPSMFIWPETADIRGAMKRRVGRGVHFVKSEDRRPVAIQTAFRVAHAFQKTEPPVTDCLLSPDPCLPEMVFDIRLGIAYAASRLS